MLQSLMSIFFYTLTTAVLAGAAVLQVWLVWSLVTSSWRHSVRDKTSAQELLMRVIAVVVGVLIYIGSKAIGVSVPQLAYDAMSPSFPFSVALGGVVFPTLLGFFVSWFIVRHIGGRNEFKDAVTMRVLAMVITLIFFTYVDCWFYAYSKGGDALQLLPNLTFILSALLYAIFKYQPYRAPVMKMGREDQTIE